MLNLLRFAEHSTKNKSFTCTVKRSSAERSAVVPWNALIRTRGDVERLLTENWLLSVSHPFPAVMRNMSSNV